jgi:lipopolysaccharide transport system ATP-binding protein
MDHLVDVRSLWKKYSGDLKKSFRYASLQLLRGSFGLGRQTPELRSKEFWALQDIHATVRRGEVLAVLGHNGAGKSTLLKCLTGNLRPDRGSIDIRGEVGHIIEMSAGFSPRMSGRENVTIRGRLLGKNGKPLENSVAAVREFADIGDFFDSPVQFYSSGMKSRLGFAASSCIEPDVLVLDEILAVGDLGFRMKCYARIDELRQKCAVIMVSHSMNQVSRMASKSLYLQQGRIEFQGDPQKAIALYQQHAPPVDSKSVSFRSDLVRFQVHGDQGPLVAGDTVHFADRLRVEGDIQVATPLTLSVILQQAGAGPLVEWNSRRSGLKAQPCQNFKVQLGPQCLCPGSYQLLVLGFSESGEQQFLSEPFPFRVAGEYLNNISLQPLAKWHLA